jgi:DNA-binding NtrC family response regulator
LLNFVEKMVIVCEGEFNSKLFDDLYTELLDYSLIHEEAVRQSQPSLRQALRQKARKDEVDMIRWALEEVQFRKTEAAKKLGLSRTTLWRKLRTMR